MALREEPTRWDAESLSAPTQSRRLAGDPPTPFDDQETFDRFVHSLHDKVKKQLTKRLDRSVQLEIGRVMWLLSSMPRGQIYQNRAFFEMVFDLLATDDPNLLLAAELRAQLVVSSERSTRLGRLIVGKVPVQSVVLGLLSTLLVLFVAILLLDLSQAYLRQVGQDPSPLHPLAQVLLHMPIEQIIILIVAAFMGAVVSVLSRLHSIRESSRTKPLLVYLTVATKPLVSIAFATFIYAIIGSGFIAVSSVSLSDPSVGYMVWSIGFLSGFSERFVKDFMGQADRIVAPGIPHVQSQTSSLTR